MCRETLAKPCLGLDANFELRDPPVQPLYRYKLLAKAVPPEIFICPPTVGLAAYRIYRHWTLQTSKIYCSPFGWL